MNLPIAIVAEGAVLHVITNPYQLEGPDGTRHPASLWGTTTAEEWADRCRGWTFLPVIDTPPTDPTKTHTRAPESEWEVTAEAVTVTYRTTDKSPQQLAVDLAAAQTEAVDQVNREAGEARARFITVTIGQEGTYIDKGNEATAFLADEAPTAAKYPYLYAEADATGQPVESIAALVNQTALAWRPLNARIEGLRQGALKAVKDAGTPAAVAAVFPIAWPMPG
ncbi:hypothetical protein ACHMW5_35785 (plasmid) [Azospirillum melinis]|uniref:hypothetical protein n=1 Tax=Azospirillum melinis TaxID=328839 RepID=UPI003757C03E